jgi:hypothetical protein
MVYDLTREQAETLANDHFKKANDLIDEGIELAEKYALEVSFSPSGSGYFQGPITFDYARHLVESGEFETLESWNQERVKDVLAQESDEERDNWESWQTSFC